MKLKARKVVSMLAAALVLVSVFGPGASAQQADEKTTEEKYEILKDAHIFDGDEQGNAKLYDNMTRAQFAAIIARVWEKPLNVEASRVYDDLAGAGWAAGYIGAVTQMGFMYGTDERKFSPSSDVTLEQLAAVLARGLSLYGYEDGQEELNGNISDWARFEVSAAVKSGYFTERTDYTVPAKRSDLVDFAYSAYMKYESVLESGCRAVPADLAADDAMKEFAAIAAQAKEACDLTMFMDVYVPKVSATDAAKMLDTLLAFYRHDAALVNGDLWVIINKINLDENMFIFYSDFVDKLEDSAFKTWYSNKLAGKYTLKFGEGASFYLDIDYAALLSYSTYLPADYKSYLELKEHEYSVGVYPEADQQEAFILQTEQFLQSFPQSPKRAEVLDMYVTYLHIYFIGGKYTPVFIDQESFEGARRSFSHFAESHSRTVAAEITKQYLKVLEMTGYDGYAGDGEGFKPELEQFYADMPKRVEELLSPRN